MPPRKPVSSPVSLESFLGEFRAAFAGGSYETALIRVNNAAAHFYDQNNFRVAMPLYRAYANLADPFTTIDPSDGQEEAIRKSTVFKDMSRNYVKFMLNTQQVHPELCRTTNCIELGWTMMEQIKSRLLRIDLINSALSRLAPEARQEVRTLMTKAKDERMARIKLRMATGNLLDPTEKDSAIAALDAELARYLPEFTDLAGKIASLEQVRASLADNETLLSFVYTNNLRKVYLFKLEKNGPLDPSSIVIKSEILTVNLFDAIEDIKEAMVAGSSLEAVSAKLRDVYGGLLDKVNLQPNRRLIIATDQNLSALPFDLLPLKDGRRMIDVFDITYVPSATVFHYLRQKRTLLRAEGGIWLRLCRVWLSWGRERQFDSHRNGDRECCS